MRPLLAVATPLALVAAPPAATTEPDDSAPTPFAEMLAMAPADSLAASAMLFYVDMDLVWDRLGVGDDVTERLESVGGLMAPETFALFPQLFHRFGDVDGAVAEVGFSGFEVHRELAVMNLPSVLVIDQIAAPAEAVVAAMEANPDWSDQLQEVDSAHGPYFSWGDGPDIDAERTSAFRRLGQAGQFAILEGDAVTTVRTIDADRMEATLATVTGERDSVADAGPFAMADDALGDADVLQLVGVPGPTSFRPPLFDSAEQLEALLADMVFVLPYLGLIVVETIDGDDVRSEVLMFNVSGAAADENADLVEAAIETGIDPATGSPLAGVFPDAIVSAEGTVVRVSVEGPGHFRTLLDMLHQASLFPS